MRCRHCDYSLWNLTTRQCPECGAPFRPGEYEFAPGKVLFCCPHCAQRYYGTSAVGRLVPDAFECVRCGRHVHEDEMVLRAAEGVAEEETAAERAPWLQRDRHGWFKGWIKTVGWSLVQPQRLMQSIPPDSSLRAAWSFTIATFIATFTVAIIPLTLLVIGLSLLSGAANRGGPGVALISGVMTGSLVVGVVVIGVMSFALISLWGLLTHLLLRLTGPTSCTIGRTYQALCYSAGVYVITLFPCCGQQIAMMIWWLVSATIMIRAAHAVSGWRAAFATLLPPVSGLLLLIGAYIAAIAVAITQPGALGTPDMTSAGSAGFEVRLLSAELQAWANANNGRGPAHALQMVPNGAIGAGNFISADASTTQQEVRAGDLALNEFQVKGSALQRRIADELADALSAEVIAHRVGDFVFPYHGIDFNTAPGAVWIVVWSPAPTANPGLHGLVYGTLDGTVNRLGASEVRGSLAAQNELRASLGLAPLPPPATVTENRPATGSLEQTPGR